MRIVIAIGSNALLERGETPEADVQRRHVRRAAQALVPIAADHQLVICYGSGPQVGALAHKSEIDKSIKHPYPLDAIVAQTQGMIGYWLVHELRNAGLRRPAVALVTQTVVDVDDPAFAAPAKFIGPVYDRRHALALAGRHGWDIAADGSGWRRVVAAPEPVDIVEEETISSLLKQGHLVVCGGGGGIPVSATADGLADVDAVVDKDLVASLLALRLGAERLLILTDVPGVMRGFGTAAAEPIRAVDADELAGMEFPAGSMGAKAEACVRFVRAAGYHAAIGALEEAVDVLAGRAGTTVSVGHRAHRETV